MLLNSWFLILEISNCVMKLSNILAYSLLGQVKGYNFLYGLYLVIFSPWYIGHVLIYSLISFLSPFYLNLCLINSIVFMTPQQPAKGSLWYNYNNSQIRLLCSGIYNLSLYSNSPSLEMLYFFFSNSKLPLASSWSSFYIYFINRLLSYTAATSFLSSDMVLFYRLLF